MANEETMELLPVPLAPRHEAQLSRKLRELSRTMSREEIVEQRLEEIYRWEEIKDPVTRRFFRNATLAWSRAELAALVSATVQQHLPAEPPEEP